MEHVNPNQLMQQMPCLQVALQTVQQDNVWLLSRLEQVPTNPVVGQAYVEAVELKVATYVCIAIRIRSMLDIQIINHVWRNQEQPSIMERGCYKLNE